MVKTQETNLRCAGKNPIIGEEEFNPYTELLKHESRKSYQNMDGKRNSKVSLSFDDYDYTTDRNSLSKNKKPVITTNGNYGALSQDLNIHNLSDE